MLIETEMNRKVRKIISLLLAVCCIIMLNSCGKQANHRTVQVDDRTIRFGATEDDILKVLGTPDSEEDYAENEKNLRYDKPVITNFGKVESITFCFSACNYYDNEEIPLRTERQRTEIIINYSTTDGKCVVLMDDTLGYLIDQMRENK